MPENDRFLIDQHARFGIKAGDIQAQDLVVPRGEMHVISQEDPKMPGVKWVRNAGRKLRPQSFADVKKWIGIPDPVARRIQQPGSLLPVSALAPFPGARGRGKAPAGPMPDLLAVAKNYLLGDSSLQLQYSDFLAQLIHDIDIWVPFLRDVTVEHDATLVIARDVKSFNARNIVIKTGGKMDSRSDMLHINCRSMTGNVA